MSRKPTPNKPKAKPTGNGKAYDVHHLCFPRKEWNKGASKALRTHWYLRVSIPRETLHWQIHNEMSVIPVPRTENVEDALAVLQFFEYYKVISPDDPIDFRLKVLMFCFIRGEPKVFEALEQQYDIVRKFYPRQ